ncbi:hypothetical protein CAter282_0717 [Collimonas arenae]|uniref:Uncharacterized protein n=1 Tax=Collimonas arenae TaxID=279058 RepID=A0A127PLG3_9BURK|nr:hypothetical protein CAter10_0775 [Collimonas arenae]AMP08520.1 hypothetical protein CAter282_0717 [Collimonas arenae]
MFEFEQYTFEYKYFMMSGDIANMLFCQLAAARLPDERVTDTRRWLWHQVKLLIYWW